MSTLFCETLPTLESVLIFLDVNFLEGQILLCSVDTQSILCDTVALHRFYVNSVLSTVHMQMSNNISLAHNNI